MSEISRKRADDFLKVSGQFKLGALATESSHPVTAQLSDVARRDTAKALDLLFQVDGDVVAKFREFAESGRAGDIKETLLRALKNGGRLFFTGCGSTGRLSIQLVSIWRDFWQRQQARSGGQDFSWSSRLSVRPDKLKLELQPQFTERAGVRSASLSALAADFENRAFSVMAGGDFALIKSVEGFEDFPAFGEKQMSDLGVSAKDVVFAITEGGETSFVIGTAWKGVEAGAKVYFVYNNPDNVLCRHVERSRKVIADARIEKINLTTGPMAIAGSTRMQATTIQLCVLLTVLEMVLRDLMKELETGGTGFQPVSGDIVCGAGYSNQSVGSADKQDACPTRSLDSAAVPAQFLARLEEMHAALRSPEVLSQLAKLVALEESVYHAGGKNNYFADRFALDVLTDTTERSPTYCTPPFRKFDDATAADSWAFLFMPEADTPRAWERLLKRPPQCVAWNEDEARALVGADKFARTREIIGKISASELMRFKIGLDGLHHRVLKNGDCAVGIVSAAESKSLLAQEGFHRMQLEAARRAGASLGLIYFCSSRCKETQKEVRNKRCEVRTDQNFVETAATVLVPVPETDFLLDGVTRVGVKMLLNALSTCTMVRLGRVMGNTMIRVVPSNLKLIDRATRYIQKLTNLTYEQSNHLLFEVIEYVEPRMKADQAHPPVVGLAVMRARLGVGNEEAEQRLKAEWG